MLVVKSPLRRVPGRGAVVAVAVPRRARTSERQVESGVSGQDGLPAGGDRGEDVREVADAGDPGSYAERRRASKVVPFRT